MSALALNLILYSILSLIQQMKWRYFINLLRNVNINTTIDVFHHTTVKFSLQLKKHVLVCSISLLYFYVLVCDVTPAFRIAFQVCKILCGIWL